MTTSTLPPADVAPVDRARTSVVGQVLDATTAAIERVPLWFLATALFVVLASANGIVQKSADVILRYARAPFSPPPLRGAGYLVTSPLTVVLAHAFGASDSIRGFTWFFFALVIAAFVVSIAAVRRVAGEPVAKLVVIALFCGPLGAVLLTWLGKPDPVTFAIGTALVLTRSPRVAFVLAMVGGTNHFEQVLVIVLTLGLVDVADRHRMRARAASIAGLVGAFAGKAIVALYLGAFGINSHYDRLAFAAHDHSWIGSQLRTTGGVLAVSAFAAWWLFPIVLGKRVWSTDRRVATGWALAVAVVAVVTIFTIDQTRVFSLLTWPLVVWSLCWSVEHLGERSVRRAAACCLLLGLVFPARLDVYHGVELGPDKVFFLTAPSASAPVHAPMN